MVAYVTVHAGRTRLLAAFVAKGTGIHDSEVECMSGRETKGGVRVGGVTDGGKDRGGGGVRNREQVRQGGGGGRGRGDRVKGAGRGVAVGQLEVIEREDVQVGNTYVARGTVSTAGGKGI